MRADSIVGYVYRAELWCGPCIARKYHASPNEDAEAILNYSAEIRRINRHDEPTYDSENFPKVAFACGMDLGDQCCMCGEYLLDGVPEGAAGVDCLTAAHWHGGQDSALYSLASTGEVHGFEHRDDCLREIALAYREVACPELDGELNDLASLRRQLEAWPDEAA